MTEPRDQKTTLSCSEMPQDSLQGFSPPRPRPQVPRAQPGSCQPLLHRACLTLCSWTRQPQPGQAVALIQHFCSLLIPTRDFSNFTDLVNLFYVLKTSTIIESNHPHLHFPKHHLLKAGWEEVPWGNGSSVTHTH